MALTCQLSRAKLVTASSGDCGPPLGSRVTLGQSPSADRE